MSYSPPQPRITLNNYVYRSPYSSSSQLRSQRGIYTTSSAFSKIHLFSLFSLSSLSSSSLFLQLILTEDLLPDVLRDLEVSLELFLPCVKHCVRYLECTDEQDRQYPCLHGAFSMAGKPKCKQVIKECTQRAKRRLNSGGTCLLREVLPKDVTSQLTPEGTKGICQLNGTAQEEKGGIICRGRDTCKVH